MSALVLMFMVVAVLALGCFICHITVIIQMFMHEEVGLALVSIFLCGLVPFFYGWAKANEWDNVLLMIAWTVCNVCYVLSIFILIPLVPQA